MKKFIVSALALVLVVLMMPIAVFASVDYTLGTDDCDFYNLVQKKDYNLAPGAEESEIVINNATGTNRNVIHAIEVDLSNPNISVMPTYKGINEDLDMDNQNNWGAQVLTQQAAHVENDLGLNVVGGINVNLRYNSDHAPGVLIWNGVTYSNEYVDYDHLGSKYTGGYLAISRDGKAMLYNAADEIPEDTYQALSLPFAWLVKDGVNQATTEDHNDSNRAPRTVIGIKEDGTLVLMMNDGRQSPYSAGMTSHEMAETMIALGCVQAMNCDGGGSSTFISEREGTGELTMKSSPSDGGERATLTGLLVISKAVADGNFDHASIEATEQYVTPGSSVEFTATGADSAGGPAEIPDDITWALEDSSMGTVEDSIFTSNGTAGKVTVQMLYNGNVVGEASTTVVIPEEIHFAQENITVPYGKAVDFDIRATINDGLNTVKVKASDFDIALSDDSLGSVSGFTYTACEEGAISGTVSATFVYDETLVATANIVLGRGSEVVYDFEDGSLGNLTFGTGYGSKHAEHPELGRFETGSIEIVNENTGKVHSGEKALALNCNFGDYYAMGYTRLDLKGLGVDLTDAVSAGFWVYIPTEAIGVEFDFNNTAIVVDSGDLNYYSKDGWYYISATPDDGVSGSFNSIELYHTDGGTPYKDAKGRNASNIKSDFVIYIDDITVDYSTAVDDREAPEFSSVQALVTADSYETVTDGYEFDSNEIILMAEAKENTGKTNYTGLDAESARVYVDGYRVKSGVTSTNGVISLSAELSDGTHKIRFEISDGIGNVGYIERTVVVNTSKGKIWVEAEDSGKDYLLMGSLQYIDIMAEDMSNVESVETVLDLDGMNEWELDHMEVAQGFEATYSVDKNNDATIEISKVGTAKSGKGALVRIPVRVFQYTTHLRAEAAGCTCMATDPTELWDSGSGAGVQLITFILKTDAGNASFEDGSEETFAGQEIRLDTEQCFHRSQGADEPYKSMVASKATWHYCVEGEPQDKEATCIEDGYTGRTFCVGCACGTETEHDASEGCGAVIDWGETVSKGGHSYALSDKKAVCEYCGETNSLYAGFLQDSKGWSYFLEGTAVTSWIYIDGNWHFFLADGYAATGTVNISGRDYRFEGEQGKSLGAWDGDRYYIHINYVKNSWVEIDSAKYYFDNSGNKCTGNRLLKANGSVLGAYEFDENGALVGEIDGIFKDAYDGNLYYATEGVLNTGLGLIEMDGDYYYVRSNGIVVSNDTWYVDKNNSCGFKAGVYTFDENGKLMRKNGVMEVDGVLRYYIDDVAQKGLGVVKVGDNFYYVRANGVVVSNGTWYVDKSNSYSLPAGTYEFDAEGRMKVLDGIVEVQGTLRYYIEGVPQVGVGVVKVGENYYYVRSNGVVVSNGTWYISKYNRYDFPAGTYEFDENGKMQILDGIVEVKGVLRYYIEGVPQAGVGVVKVGDNYYYVRSNGVVVSNGTWYINRNNHYNLPAGTYEFDADGKMKVLDGIVEVNGVLKYYVAGVPQTGLGLVEIGGYYYYIRSNGTVVTDGIWYVDKNNSYGFAAGTYTFNADGKMVD